MIGPPAGLFITGTDTGVGKTRVTAVIARELRAGTSGSLASGTPGLRIGACKPACSGAVFDPGGEPIWDDIEALAEALDREFPPERIGPQRFLAPLAPPVAAHLEGKRVDPGLLRDCVGWWRGKVDLLLIEGVGGLLCPLTEQETVADLASDLGYPLLIVGRLGLGTINHTLLTVEVARARKLPIAGIVLSETAPPSDRSDSGCAAASAEETNPAEIAARCDAPLLGVMRFGEYELRRAGEPVRIDWRTLAAGSAAR